jgi:hypothetical protein
MALTDEQLKAMAISAPLLVQEYRKALSALAVAEEWMDIEYSAQSTHYMHHPEDGRPDPSLRVALEQAKEALNQS